jgi:hypothetical protein
MQRSSSGIAVAIALTSGSVLAQADWTQMHPATSPPARIQAAMAQFGDKMVLFGGCDLDTGVALNDTWLWDGSNWTQITRFGIFGQEQPPPARCAASMAFDPDTNQILLFGGIGVGGLLADTWAFNFTSTRIGTINFNFFNWNKLAPPTSPPARSEAVMDYDPSTKTIILATGAAPGHDLQDTWSFDPAATTWTLLPGIPLQPFRAQSVMSKCGQAFNCSIVNGQLRCPLVAAPNQMLLFGGENGATLGDTFDLTGTSVSSLAWGTSTVPSPPARFGAGMAYYPVSASAVLYGGQGNPNILSDTWNGGCLNNFFPSWSQATPAHNPGLRAFHSMATGPGGFTLVVFGGLKITSTGGFQSNETWTWGRRVACLPADGNTLDAGAEVSCQFAPADGVSFESWRAEGFAPGVSHDEAASFRAVRRGEASITARWTDAAGPHEDTIEYTIVR